MFVQPLFEEPRREAQLEFIARYPLGVIVTNRSTGIEVDHLPFVVHAESEAKLTLRCHSARANPLWQVIGVGAAVMVAFSGPNAYISPNWMPGRKRHGKVAPSWNYAAVHAYGTAHAIEDREWLRAQLRALSSAQEAHRAEPWSLDEPPTEFTEQLLDHIVGIEVSVERLIGKWFVGQQRSPSDREGVVTGLLEEGTDAATEIAAMMKAYAPKP